MDKRVVKSWIRDKVNRRGILSGTICTYFDKDNVYSELDIDYYGRVHSFSVICRI